MIRQLHTYVLECDECQWQDTVVSTQSSNYGVSLWMMRAEERPQGWGEKSLADGSGYGGGGSSTYLFCPRCYPKFENRFTRWEDV